MCIFNFNMGIKEFLNDKYYELISQEKRRISVEEFGAMFEVSKSLMTMWMNGQRTPGPEAKRRIIERYGDEAIIAFGDDPDLHVIQENWEYINPETKKHLRAEVEQAASDRLRESQKQRRTKQAS